MGLREIIETRLIGADLTMSELREQMREITAQNFVSVAERRMYEEKFRSIDRQLADAETLSAERFENVAARAIATNTSNTNAVYKIEANFAKQIDNIITLFRTNSGTMSDKLVALTARIDRGEGQLKGPEGATAQLVAALAENTARLTARLDSSEGRGSGTGDMTRFIFAGILSFGVLVNLGIAFATFMHEHPTTPVTEYIQQGTPKPTAP